MRAIELNPSTSTLAIATTTAMVNENMVATTLTTTNNEISSIAFLNYFMYNKERNKLGDVKNCLLGIATLIVTSTFQAVRSPPSGAWQDNNSSGGGSASKAHITRQAIMQSHSSFLYGFFLMFNTMEWDSLSCFT
ncbi:uncharacterized protein LOC114296743 [Camellia sinensis]|uniref:PGG domain-containing protein n=1 Tax=Camellia sinensis var. sinensis TaxID=542762 RepID=A0A4S4DDX6_CAMSN|nr:uncharacterized protein LOC114296743 [Camellia sinensis]THG00404.1 hypothetical protein TEA_024623 [Camellia sinensis var. sinensis]